MKPLGELALVNTLGAMKSTIQGSCQLLISLRAERHGREARGQSSQGLGLREAQSRQAPAAAVVVAFEQNIVVVEVAGVVEVGLPPRRGPDT